MNHKQSKLVIGSALGLAALAAAIDHTRHPLPDPELQQYEQAGSYSEDEAPCGLDMPCGLGNPCSLDDEAAPCGLD